MCLVPLPVTEAPSPDRVYVGASALRTRVIDTKPRRKVDVFVFLEQRPTYRCAITGRRARYSPREPDMIGYAAINNVRLFLRACDAHTGILFYKGGKSYDLVRSESFA